MRVSFGTIVVGFVVLSFVWFIINVLHGVWFMRRHPAEARARYLARTRARLGHGPATRCCAADDLPASRGALSGGQAVHARAPPRALDRPRGISWEWERGGTLKPISGEGKP